MYQGRQSVPNVVEVQVGVLPDRALVAEALANGPVGHRVQGLVRFGICAVMEGSAKKVDARDCEDVPDVNAYEADADESGQGSEEGLDRILQT